MWNTRGAQVRCPRTVVHVIKCLLSNVRAFPYNIYVTCLPDEKVFSFAQLSTCTWSHVEQPMKTCSWPCTFTNTWVWPHISSGHACPGSLTCVTDEKQDALVHTCPVTYVAYMCSLSTCSSKPFPTYSCRKGTWSGTWTALWLGI